MKRKRKLKQKKKIRIRSYKGELKRKKKFKLSRSVLLSDLQAWEKDQIELAIRLRKRRIELKLPRIEDLYGRLYLQPLFLKQDLDTNLKAFNFKHLLDASGKLQYWGALPASMRPQRKLLPNGDLSIEDMVLNPLNPPRQLPRTSRARARAKVLNQIMKLSFAVHEPQLFVPRTIRVDEPKKIDSFIKDTEIRLSESADPEQETRALNWLLSNATHGSRRFDSRLACIKAAKSDMRSNKHTKKGYYLVTYDGPSNKYTFRRYVLRIKRANDKLTSKLQLTKKFKY